MRRTLLIFGAIVAAVFILRAIVEVPTIDYGDPARYAHGWGGPSLLGVPVRSFAAPCRRRRSWFAFAPERASTSAKRRHGLDATRGFA